ncbi:MAG: hypothetical protein ACI87W_002307, partial [Halieaceae bacterium]
MLATEPGLGTFVGNGLNLKMTTIASDRNEQSEPSTFYAWCVVGILCVAA